MVTDNYVILHGSAVAERGEEVTLAPVVTDVHSGTAVAECLGIISHEGTSLRSHEGLRDE